MIFFQSGLFFSPYNFQSTDLLDISSASATFSAFCDRATEVAFRDVFTLYTPGLFLGILDGTSLLRCSATIMCVLSS